MNNQITNKEIETLLPWGEGKRVSTVYGDRILRKAKPTSQFWGYRRKNEAELRKAGVSVGKDKQTQEWEACWWQSVDGETIPAEITAPVIAPQQSAFTLQSPRMETVLPELPEPEIETERVWSDEQKTIFLYFKEGKGHMVIVARAGTGKTTTIKAAFEFAPEETMLYVVFNKRNQIEAQEKITDPRVDVKTHHSLGFSFILAIWPNSKPDAKIEAERLASLISDIPDEVAGAVLKLVSFAKNTTINPTIEVLIDIADARGIEAPGYEDVENGGWTVTRIADVALSVMNISKQRDKQGRISFDDMVWLPVVMGWVRPNYDLVVVDEAQDMNWPQLLMAEGACKKTGRVCVVGDDRQAIYHFRGAATDGMALMKSRLNAAQLGLTTTYRCPKKVVAMAAIIVPDYKAAPSAPEGIVEAISSGAMLDNAKIGDAILSRINAPLMGNCLRLLKKGIPARIEGKDIGKQLVGIVRKLKAKSVPNFLEKINRWGEKMRVRSGKSKHAEEKIAEINDQVATLIAVAEGASSVHEIESRLLDLFQDSNQNSKPAVVLSSVHKAKGLEWNRVFILSETFRRKPKKGSKPANAASSLEEQNIYYVAITRTKRHLFLVDGETPVAPILKDGQSLTTAA